MKRIAAVTALAIAATLAACGGDEASTGGGGAATPTQRPNLGASPSGGIDIRGEITKLTTPEPALTPARSSSKGKLRTTRGISGPSSA